MLHFCASRILKRWRGSVFARNEERSVRDHESYKAKTWILSYGYIFCRRTKTETSSESSNGPTPTSNWLCAGPRLHHAPISLCGVNLCTLVYQNLPDCNCGIVRLLRFELRVWKCVQRWWTLTGAILRKKIGTYLYADNVM